MTTRQINRATSASALWIMLCFGAIALANQSLTPGHRDLPDPKLTPGATFSVAAKDVCVPGYSKSVRNVPSAVKKRVFDEYGIVPKPREYEIDHLISLELGGSNDLKNLWPQSYLTHPWNAHLKDRVEDEMHRRVCLPDADPDHMTLEGAQNAIRGDWTVWYRKFYGDPPSS